MIKSLIGLLILTLSRGNCQDVDSVYTTDLSEGTRLKLKSAYEKNNLLSVEWSMFPGEPSFVTFTVRLDNLVDDVNDTCVLHHHADNDSDTIELMSIHQLSHSHVLSEWKHSCKDKIASYESDIRKILIMDIFSCECVKNITYPVSTEKVPRDLIVYYDEGFDVLMTGWDCGAATNCRERYNSNGKKLFDVNFLPLKFSWMTWQSVSKKSRSKGLFVRGTNAEENTSTEVYLVDGEAKHLLSLRSRNRLISHVESERWYAICGEDVYEVELIICAQYHVRKDKVFETRMALARQVKFVGVRGLARGGVLLFAIEGNAKLVVSEMTTGNRTEIYDFDLKWPACEESDFAIEVSRLERSFSVVYESREPKHRIIMQTFEFPRGLSEN